MANTVFPVSAFSGGAGDGNSIFGAGAGNNSVLNQCSVTGVGAAVNAEATASCIDGEGACHGATISLSMVRGPFAGRYGVISNSNVTGYSSCEYGNISLSDLSGRYSGHSGDLANCSGSGDSVLAYAIGEKMIASGTNAGYAAEGSNLVMIGDFVTTQFVPSSEIPVSVQSFSGAQPTPDGDIVYWQVNNHPFGPAGSRVNLKIVADVMPSHPFGQFYSGYPLPFTVHDANSIIYTGNKYPAVTPGSNVRVMYNTFKPVNSTAIGMGSVITASNQFVVNGVIQ